MDTNQYMGMFMDESREHLQALNRCLLELEAAPGNLQLLDEIFRSAHTLKGMSATMGFHDIAEITHEMENILDMLRKGQMRVTSGIVDLLFKCLDCLEQLVEGVAEGSVVHVDTAGLVVQIRTAAAGDISGLVLSSTEAAATVAEVEIVPDFQIPLNDVDYRTVSAAMQKGLHTYEIQVGLNETCLLKAARAYLVFSALEDMGDIIKSQPQVADIEKENFEKTFTILFVSGHDVNQIQQTILAISEVDKASIKAVEPSNCKPHLELVKDTRQQASGAQEVKEIETASAGSNGTANSIHKNKVNQTVRVDIEKLDSLLNLVGELVINKTRLDQIGNTQRLPDLAETIESMDRITTDLQNVVMKVRMVPVSQVFNRFPRMIRDLARDLSKEINLVIEGEETELDRTVIDEIGDPLVHLLRNAIDHGVEMPQDRINAGKSSVGEVKLVARQEGNNVVIEVIDNGKGINPETLKNKAVEKGLMSRVEADRLDTNEAVRIVFLPGFSTAQAVTDVSGRGVGMDAVRSKIESLGGTVEVDTRLGQGSRFTIRLPLTLAIIQALLISVGDEKYAVPLGTIDSTIKIKANDRKTIQGREVILLRGNVIPIVRLAEQLQAPKSFSADDEELYVVIVQMGEKRAGFVVDTLIGQQEIVIKSLGKVLGMIRCIAGATILGDGQVALILDVGTFMQ
jgi:two-component system, chemotaxis family, sensor kinase CheA